MKKMISVFALAIALFATASVASAQPGYDGYYASYAYDRAGGASFGGM